MFCTRFPSKNAGAPNSESKNTFDLVVMSYITLSIVFFIASVYTGGLMPMLSSLLVGFSNHFAITAGGRVENIIL